MLKETIIRKRIWKRIERMSSDKLNDILKYLESLDTNMKNKKQILSYAGTWNDLDSETFSEFTDNLIDRRISSSRRK
ncbi:hypothetical protein ES705_38805 [subsurface metagenome]